MFGIKTYLWAQECQNRQHKEVKKAYEDASKAFSNYKTNLQHTSFEDFDKAMRSDEPLRLG